MIRRPRCPICLGESASNVGMFLAPWFMALAEISPTDGFVSIRRCTSCEFWWSDRGIIDREVSCVYSGYRGGQYTKIRKRFEPWYLKRHNQDRTVNDVIRYRRDLTPAAIEEWFASRPSLKVLDFGGGTGEMIPQWAKDQTNYVVDESIRNRQEGANAISLDEAKMLRFDVVTAMHVAEHLDDPVGQLLTLAGLLETGGLVYVEVPLDGTDLPFRQPLIDNRFAQRSLRWVHRTSFSSVICQAAWILSDFVVTGCQLLSPIRVRRLKISEHINYFSERAMWRLGAEAGLDQIATVYLRPDRAGKAVRCQEGSLGMWFRKGETKRETTDDCVDGLGAAQDDEQILPCAGKAGVCFR